MGGSPHPEHAVMVASVCPQFGSLYPILFVRWGWARFRNALMQTFGGRPHPERAVMVVSVCPQYGSLSPILFVRWGRANPGPPVFLENQILIVTFLVHVALTPFRASFRFPDVAGLKPIVG